MEKLWKNQGNNQGIYGYVWEFCSIYRQIEEVLCLMWQNVLARNSEGSTLRKAQLKPVGKYSFKQGKPSILLLEIRFNSGIMNICTNPDKNQKQLVELG